MQQLALSGVSKHYHKVVAVREVTLTLEPGETLALIGPSGCGKSTLLRLIAGLEPVTSGRIYFGGQDITQRSARARGFGMVFQDYALFPHLNVIQNVLFGLAQLPPRQRRARAREMLALVALEDAAERRIHELSGGQQQRVALARALAPRPPLLLLDEPLSNLDYTLRETLKQELAQLLAELKLQAIYVTHDQAEAFMLAQRVAVMRDGAIVQLGDKSELFSRPRTPWVARFLGHANVYMPAELAPLGIRQPMLLRSELIRVGEGGVPATVRARALLGEMCLLTLELSAWQLTLRWRGFMRELAQLPQVGEVLYLNVPEAAWVPLAPD